MSRYLERLGHEVLVAKARQVRIIYDNDRKTEKSDARTLARARIRVYCTRFDTDARKPKQT